MVEIVETSDRLSASFAENLLAPRVVALVGASGDPSKAAARPLRFLRERQFGGNVYPINPRSDVVGGERAFASLADLPERPDHVFVLSGTKTVVPVIEECARLGVPLATVLASGFGEDGEEGRRRQEAITRIAREGGVRLIGPSSLGVVNPRNGFFLTGNAAFAEEIPAGGVFVASQSGSVMGAIASRGKAVGIGFAGMVSAGGEADLSVGQLCRAVVDDPGVESFALFLEAIQHPEDLVEFGYAAHAAGKPVVVYQLGRSPQAAALSESHTGAIAGEDDESEAFLSACGFVRVTQFEALIETPRLAVRSPQADRRRKRVGVITSTGGGAALVVDELALRGIEVAAPSPATCRALAEAGVPDVHGLIVDLTLAATRHQTVSDALRILQDSGEFDLICMVIGSSARSNPELAVRAAAQRADGAVPLAVFAVPDALDSLAALNEAGVPAFRTPEACANAVAGVLTRRSPSARTALRRRANPSRLLDERESGTVLSTIGIGLPPSVVLDAVVDDPPFGYPVVAKGLSADLAHKSDVGAVVLGIEDRAALVRAAVSISASVGHRAPSARLGGILVQPMIGGVIAEVLLGARVSDRVGPMVVLAMGGMLAELYDEASIRLAPVTAEVAREMIGEVRGLATIRGFRGAVHGDEDALVRAIVAVSEAIVGDESLAEIEINPLAVRAEGVVALDAAVRVVAHDGER